MTSRKINITHIFSLSLLFVLLVAGCTATPAPVALPLDVENGTATQTATIQPTFTPEPSATPFPTDTPTPTSGPTVPLSAEGPWLVYLRTDTYTVAKLENEPTVAFSDKGLWLASHSSATFPAAIQTGEEEFAMMNQDGSGRTLITWSDCAKNVNAFLMSGENVTNYMTSTHRGIYIFRPSQTTGMLVYRDWSEPSRSRCRTYFSGDEKSGLLASIYQAADDAIPELVIYELPSGKIRSRFPLVQCPAQAKDCEGNPSLLRHASLNDTGGSQPRDPQWSPNGRYLAFAALMNTTSTDLYVYDKQTSSLRRLTSGPDWVGPIEWSPDGTQIIMGEILNSEEYPFAPPPNISSIWSVSISGNEAKMLYALDNYRENHILMWLDNKRFLANDGMSIFSPGGEPFMGENLRLVDTSSGESRILFDSSFGSPELDKIHETIAVYAFDTEKYPQGIYLVSIKNSTVRRLEGPPFQFSFPAWDEKTGLFIFSDDCDKDVNSFQAFDYLGNFTCVPKVTPTPKPLGTARYPAPNGKWTVTLKDGVWLESQGKAAVQVSPETASDIIWCPDSSCFFFSGSKDKNRRLDWSLYRVSLPDLGIKMVDEWTGPSREDLYVSYFPDFRWIGVTK